VVVVPAAPAGNGEKKEAEKKETGRAAQPAKVLVSLPAEAKLYIDGQLSKQTSAARTIVTPALERGAEYAYTLKVEFVRDGKTVTDTKEVAFRAGSTIKVDFSKLEATATASR
jgi:uncharacterized protein (TIGR03000 family)